MIFPFYLDGKFPYRQKIAHSLVLNEPDQLKPAGLTQNISLTKKYSHPNDGLEWLRKKSPKNDQIKKFNSLNSIRRKNFCQLPLAKFFIRKKSLLEGKQTQQSQLNNNKSRQKRFHTQSQFLDTKRRSIILNKTFNKSFIDTEHNFTGKSYQKRVENHLNINSPQFQESKLKKFLQTATNPTTTNKQKSLQHINSFQHSFRQEQNAPNLFVKRLSIKDKVEIRKYKKVIEQDNDNKRRQNQQQSMNIKLRRQIEKCVKDDIKAEIIKYKKTKLSKLKFKPANTLKTGKKSLVIQQQTKKEAQLNQHQPQQIMSQSVSKFLTHYNCQIKFNRNKGAEVIKKSYSSFNTYELEGDEMKTAENKVMMNPVYENLQPWQGQSAEFYEFR